MNSKQSGANGTTNIRFDTTTKNYEIGFNPNPNATLDSGGWKKGGSFYIEANAQLRAAFLRGDVTDHEFTFEPQPYNIGLPDFCTACNKTAKKHS